MKPSATTILPTALGEFAVSVYPDEKGREHVALSRGDLSLPEPVLMRLQSECLTGEVFGSTHCECRPQLNAAMELIAKTGRGLLIYLRQEGRDIGLTNKIKAYELQRQGLDTLEANVKLGFPPDARHYDVAAAILRDLEISQVKLMTNNPDKIAQLESLGITVVVRVPLEIPPNGTDNKYLQIKKNKMGHLLTQV